jgi:hypothetical protein
MIIRSNNIMLKSPTYLLAQATEEFDYIVYEVSPLKLLISTKRHLVQRCENEVV